MRFFVFTLLFLSGSVGFRPTSGYAQTRFSTFVQLDSLEKTDKRPVLVFITAPWCVYCRAMKRTTFRNKKLAETLNRDFYVLELDAEKNQNIHFGGKDYRFRPNGERQGLQELAVKLGLANGQMSYPTLVFLKPGKMGKLVYPAFATARELTKMAEYVRTEKMPVK